MRGFEASTDIGASSETVWRILTDLPAYTRWDSGVERVDGKIAPNAKITVYATVAKGRAFPVTVTRLDAPREMRWASGMPLGLFKGERTFNVTSNGGNQVRFTMREEYTGLLAPLIFRSIPDLNASFRQFVNGVKRQAEHAAR
jgi:hypothetical protein